MALGSGTHWMIEMSRTGIDWRPVGNVYDGLTRNEAKIYLEILREEPHARLFRAVRVTRTVEDM